MTAEIPARRAADIPDNVRRVNDRIETACSRAGRAASEITLVAVSKTFPSSFIDLAIDAGVTNFGENRVQEFKDKVSAVQGRAKWHMIGHLQSNKARDACRLFHVVQSVDSLDLATRLSRETAVNGLRLDVLAQVNIGREPQKSGFDPDTMNDVLAELRSLPGLRVLGLMTIPPQGDAAETRANFARMRDLFDRSTAGPEFVHLSMGMSEDFDVAIEEGSTMIRVGRAIFGVRS